MKVYIEYEVDGELQTIFDNISQEEYEGLTGEDVHNKIEDYYVDLDIKIPDYKILNVYTLNL